MPKSGKLNDVEFSSASCLQLLVKSRINKRLHVFANNYVIPDFQRGYVWRKNQIERLVESISNKEGKYLGNIVILSGRGGSDYIVDGQQRLITISLICKILEVKTKESSLKKDISRLILEDGKPRISFLSKNLNTAFNGAICSVNGNKKNNDASKNIHDAITCLQKNDFLNSLNTNKKIRDFFVKICKLNFGVVFCLSPGEAYNLFEGLNSTGVILTSVEKTKNALLGKLYELDGTIGKNKVEEGRKKWSKIESRFQKSNPFWFNRFLRHQWFLVGGKVSDKKLYEEIRKLKIKSAKSTKDILGYLDLIDTDSDIYIKLRSGKLEEVYFPRNSRSNSSKDIVDVLKLFNQLEVEQVYPVLLALYKYAAGTKDYYENSRFYSDIKKLWAFSFLAKYGKVVPSNYENTFARLCLDVNNKNYKEFKIIVNSFFKKLYSIVKGGQGKFITTFNLQYNDKQDKFSKFIFSDLFKREKEIKFYEIEHILPQGKNGKGNFKNWDKIPIKDYDKLVNYIYRIGNLTFIEKTINGKVKDSSFKSKVAEYIKSDFAENKFINNYTKFPTRPDLAIEKRGKDLSKSIFGSYLNILKK